MQSSLWPQALIARVIFSQKGIIRRVWNRHEGVSLQASFCFLHHYYISKMRFIYGMLYTYLWTVLACCALLVLLVPSFSRRLFFKILDKIHVHHIAKYLFYGILIVNFIVWADSISTYYQYQGNLRSQKLEAIVEGKVDYLNLYKQTKEFYMAERNFMLTSSCLFVTFALSRFLAAFEKLYGIEKQIAEFESVAKTA